MPAGDRLRVEGLRELSKELVLELAHGRLLRQEGPFLFQVTIEDSRESINAATSVAPPFRFPFPGGSFERSSQPRPEPPGPGQDQLDPPVTQLTAQVERGRLRALSCQLGSASKMSQRFISASRPMRSPRIGSVGRRPASRQCRCVRITTGAATKATSAQRARVSASIGQSIKPGKQS